MNYLEVRLTLLIDDPEPKVRQSIAWSLQPYVEQGRVKKALEQCLQQDSSIYLRLSAALLLLTQPVLSPALLKNLADLIQNTPEDCKLDVAQKILLQPNISFEILETVLNWCKTTTNNILKQFLFTLLEIAPSRREILLTLIEVLAGEPNSETRC